MVRHSFVVAGLGALYFSHVLVAIPEIPKVPIVFVDQAKTIAIFDTLTYPARLVPKINATVLADSEGMVVKILTPLGQRVTRNQSVAVIQNTDPLYDYAPVNLTAPVTGVVSSVEITQGSRVTKGQKLFSITDPTKIKIMMEITVADTVVLTAGMVGNLRITAEGPPISVRVRGVSPIPDPATGTATAELEWTNPSTAKTLPPGLVGTVSFRAREHQGFQLPEHAVIYRGEGTFVRVVEEGKAKYQPVTAGQMRKGLVEITKGLTLGTQVILRSSTYVAEGETVKVQPMGAEAPPSE